MGVYCGQTGRNFRLAKVKSKYLLSIKVHAQQLERSMHFWMPSSHKPFETEASVNELVLSLVLVK